jgi:penicillin amidase
VVAVDGAVAGSNCWVSNPGGSNPGGSTTEGPGPMLACDLHLPLTMPNLLYEVDLRWAGERVRGLAAIGLPVVLTGSNGHLAWGVTNLSADVLDLVPVVTPTTTTTERIRVRGGPDTQLDVTFAGTMPVSPSPLLGEQVAIRWTGYDPRSLDLKFQRLAQATSVGESIKVLDEADGIALNVLVADDSGRMAHLATGLLPKAGPERPRLVDPPDGVLVSANDVAVVGDAGYDVDPGFRARRVRRLLAASASADPASMRAIQHDAAAELYLPYRDLAVAALSACRSGGEGSPLTAATERTTFVLTVAAGKTQPRPSRASRGYQIADLLAAWDGTADASSRAFPVLVRLREILAQRVLSGFLTRCREYDPSFVYPFRSLDGPLLAILHSGDPALLPAGEELNIFVARCLDDAVINPADLPTWGEVNAVGVGHPVAGLAPWSAALLGIAATPQSGALHSVRTCVPGFGAVGRAVLAAGYASFELPGGQSGHPLSKHYDDRHARWSSTDPPAERAPQPGCTFVLRPTSSGSGDR